MISTLLVSVTLRASAALVLGLVAYVALARASAAARRALLVATLGASIVIPLAAAVVPAWRIATPAALAGFGHESELEGALPTGALAAATIPSVFDADRSVTPSQKRRLDLTAVLLGVWALGVMAVGARAFASQLRARRLVREGKRVDAVGWTRAVSTAIHGTTITIDVRISDGVDSPAVAGLVRPTILLPRGAEHWSPERSRVVLVHEVAHVLSRDPWSQLVADAACALHWFNPLAWLAASRLRVERELAADDAVLASGVRPSSYAEQLLAVAGASTAGALAMAERTAIGTRIVAILAARRSRGPLEARGMACLAAGGVAVAAAAACVSPEAASIPTVTAAAVEVSPGAPSTGSNAQVAADEVLASVADEWSPESAVVLVLDVATGEVLADAGRLAGKPFDVARARAVVPGSTLKPITIAAALETHAITSTQLFECGPKPRLYGSGQIHDSEPHGTLDAAHLLAVSSNIGVSHIFDALGGESLSIWLTRFHFADAPSLEGAATGGFPATIATGTIEGAEVAMGEGMTATPLQMAAAYATIANDGVYHAPTTGHRASPGERLVSSSTANQMMAILETAVTDATATGTLARVDGIHVAGKTGTADVVGADGHHHVYASFIGVADLPRRRVVALVGVETPREDVWGGKVAAPAFARLVERMR